jgi:hypothetical protein
LISLLLLICLSLPSYADSSFTVFKAERDCKQGQFGLFDQCTISDKTLEAERPSDTQNTFIKSLNFKNSISTFFNCRSTRNIPAGFNINGQTVDVLMQAGTIPRISTVAIPYSGGTYTFFVKIDSPAREVFPGCEFSVLSNVTTLEVEPIKEYINLILRQLENGKEKINRIDEASTLPTKWIVLVQLSGNLEAKKKDIELDLGDLKSEIVILQGKSNLSDFESTRLAALPGLIYLTEIKIKEFDLLIQDVESALPDASKCIVDNPGDRTFCLDKVTKIKESLNTFINDDVKLAEEVLQFLDAELLRLKETSDQINVQIKELACKIRAIIGGSADICS